MFLFCSYVTYPQVTSMFFLFTGINLTKEQIFNWLVFIWQPTCAQSKGCQQPKVHSVQNPLPYTSNKWQCMMNSEALSVCC